MNKELTPIAKTLFLPLKARALAHENLNIKFKDERAYDIWKNTKMLFEEASEVDFIDKIVERTELFDRMLQNVLESKEVTLVVNLGAGLCTRVKRFVNSENILEWWQVDVEEVINLRKDYFKKELTYALDLKDIDDWNILLTKIFKTEASQILFIGEGVFPYFTKQEFSKFTEKIIDKRKLTSKKVFFCFDGVHPNYKFETAFNNLDTFEGVSFSENYNNIKDFALSLSVKPSIKKYTLPFDSVYNEAYQNFVANHQGDEPYYVGKLKFETTNISSQTLGTYFEEPLQLNSAFSQTFLNNGLCFFNTKNDFYVIKIQDWIKVKFYLEDASSFALNFNEVHVFYHIEKMIDLNILVEENQVKYNNIPKISNYHFFSNQFWADHIFIEKIINECNNENISLIFSHDLYDPKAQNYANKILSHQQKCCVIVLEEKRILVSPLFTKTSEFNLYLSCININAPHLLWANKQTDEQIYCPCLVDVYLIELDSIWLMNHLKEKTEHQTITEYVLEDKSTHQHTIADYETLEQTDFLSKEDEFIVDRSSGFRTKTSAEILKNCENQISIISGVISSPKVIANLSDKLVTYNCTYPTRIPNDSLENKIFFNQSLGKGVHKQQSKISAIAEAIERFSMNYNGKEDCFFKKYVPHNDYINPLSVFNFSEQQYKEGVYNKVEEGACLYWTEGVSLTYNHKKYLPAVLCFQNTPFTERNNLRFSSNGCATGSTIKEAILQGLLELIERDAVALWWYQKRECLSVDISDCQIFVDVLEEKDWQVWVLDATTDIEIPVMVAVAQHNISNEFRLGFGAHLDTSIAVARAISEVHQIIEVAEFAKAEFDFSQIKPESYLLPKGKIEERHISNIKTIDEAIIFTRKKIEVKGYEVLYKNLSRGNLALKTVKVFVPGLCFIWPEFDNKRLLRKQNGKEFFDEKELNSLSLFL